MYPCHTQAAHKHPNKPNQSNLADTENGLMQYYQQYK